LTLPFLKDGRGFPVERDRVCVWLEVLEHDVLRTNARPRPRLNLADFDRPCPTPPVAFRQRWLRRDDDSSPLT
jgi:hypothetical protein